MEGGGNGNELGLGDDLGEEDAAGTGTGHSDVGILKLDIWLVGVVGEEGAVDAGLMKPEAGEAGADPSFFLL